MKHTYPPLVVGNWKMNPQTMSMADRLARELKKGLARIEGVSIVVAPPMPYVPIVRGVLSGASTFILGAQNAHWEKPGAHTGEVATSMLESLGVSYVIIGHSERRAMGETNEIVNKKALAVIKAGMTAIVCVGEQTRDHGGHYLGTIEEEIRTACAGLSKSKLEHLVIAYEPIWAIGTGNNATPEDVHEMRLFIEKVLSDLYGRHMAQKIRVIYGGSVNAKNAKPLMEFGTMDGFLVGGSSLNAEEFVLISKAAK